MPILRINANMDTPEYHGSPRPLTSILPSALMCPGPIIVLIHGFRFQPHSQNHCPHGHIFSLERTPHSRMKSWPRHLGFGRCKPQEGLAIAFGWNAGGHFWSAAKATDTAATALARLIKMIRPLAPFRPIHLIAHSLGAQVALKALKALRANDLNRVILMNAAAYQGLARSALETEAGRSCEVFNMVTAENAPFDTLFEWALRSSIPKDRALGRGFSAPNALTIDLSNPNMITSLRRLGFPVARRSHRICHWSTYMRPGVFPFYSALIRQSDRLSLTRLQKFLCPLY